ncbi:MAG: histidine phosphatase family protein [Leptolyngbya sp. SIO1E4]|nr:histidine phosphatase family protein [Leptolyngbya sp. SIO1E4]
MLKLLFIRHGESTGNRDKRMASHREDGLTPKGQQQCQHLAGYLYRQSWQPSHLYTSPLRRGLESLAYLLAPWGWSLPAGLGNVGNVKEINQRRITSNGARLPALPLRHFENVTVSEQLTEFQAGILTGLTWAEAKQQYPLLCHTLETSQDWVAIPGAETPLDGRTRAQQFVQQLLAKHRAGDAVWIMSHYWIMEHLVAALMGCDRTWQLSIPNTALFEFWIDRDRWWQTEMTVGIRDFWHIKRFGDCPHLKTADL